MRPEEKHTGYLSKPSRVRDKRIDEWTFISPFNECKTVSPKVPHMEVEVYLTSTQAGARLSARSIYLRAPVEDTDIGRLHERVEEELIAVAQRLVGVAWEDWIEVRVDKRRASSDRHTGGPEISYRFLKRGTVAGSDLAYTLNRNGIAVPFPQPKKMGEGDFSEEEALGFKISDDDYDTEVSYIPATPSNIAALDEVLANMERLRVYLSRALSHDVIAESLANCAENMLKLPNSSS